ncbi:MAG: hypothetical protein QXW30_02370 [Saccharolobus sp.]
MRIAVPSIVEKKTNNLTFIFSVVPPIVTIKNADDRTRKFIQLLSEVYDIKIACRDEDIKFCYPLIFGGVFVFSNNDMNRYEVNGYLCKGKEENIKNINYLLSIIEKEEWCFRFSDDEVLCHYKNKKFNECKWIDNIGLRFIMDTL